MLLWTRFLFPLFAISSQAAVQTRDTFKEYHAKTLQSTLLKLEDASYAELTSSPRNYSVVILLTAIEARFGCQLCRDFSSEWETIGKSWIRGDSRGELRVLYGTLDFIDGKETFQKVISRQVAIILISIDSCFS